MKSKKDDLIEIKIKEDEESRFFIKTEYPIIRMSTIKELVTISIREKNGNLSAYYDISGKTSLKDWLKDDKELNYEGMMSLIKAFVQLFKALEERLLLAEKISCNPNDIYVDRDGNISFLYMPHKANNVKHQSPELFNFLISRMDYGDEEGVKLVYDLFWQVRHKGMNYDVFSKYLNDNREEAKSEREIYDVEPVYEIGETPKTESEPKLKPKSKKVSFKTGEKGKSSPRIVGNKAKTRVNLEKKRTMPAFLMNYKGIMIAEILLAIVLVLDVLLAIVVSAAGYQHSFPPVAVRYLAICVVAGIIVSTVLKKANDMRLSLPESIEKRYGKEEQGAQEDYFPISP